MADLPKYAIMYGDEPARRMIAERIDDRYRYMVPRNGERRKLMRPSTVAECGPTDIKMFGFATVETRHSVRFERVCESSAKYLDGQPREWQDRTFGVNIGDSFEIPRRRK